MVDISGVLTTHPGLPPLFESEDSATAALAAHLAEEIFMADYERLDKKDQAHCRNVARTIVRNVAAMVLEDWIE